MKHKPYGISAPLIIKLATLLALTLAFLASGCEVFKKRIHEKSDTVEVKRSAIEVDQANLAGSVRKEDNRSQEENEWTRLTMKWLAEKKQGDTIINHFITPPATVIYETGKSTNQQSNTRVDSNWFLHVNNMIAMSLDSISRKVDSYQKTKESKTKGMGWVTVLLIGGAAVIVLRLRLFS